MTPDKNKRIFINDESERHRYLNDFSLGVKGYIRESLTFDTAFLKGSPNKIIADFFDRQHKAFIILKYGSPDAYDFEEYHGLGKKGSDIKPFEAITSIQYANDTVRTALVEAAGRDEHFNYDTLLSKLTDIIYEDTVRNIRQKRSIAEQISVDATTVISPQGLTVMESTSTNESRFSEFTQEAATFNDLVSNDQYIGHPQYLASGTNGHAFLVDKGDKQYVLKVMKAGGEQVVHERATLEQGIGISNITQLHAHSEADGVIITEYVPGRNLNTIDADKDFSFSDSEVSSLISTIKQMYDHGLVIDSKPANFVYDEEKGIQVLDYLSSKNNMNLAQVVMLLRFALSKRNQPNTPINSPEYMTNLSERANVYLDQLQQIFRVIDNDHPELIPLWNNYQQELLITNQSKYDLIPDSYRSIENDSVSSKIAALDEGKITT